MECWIDLPVEILEELECRLVLYVDKIRFRGICKSWNCQLKRLSNEKEKKFPWLLKEITDSQDTTHALFSPIEKKFYKIYLPEAKGKLFKGSSNGWVATVEDKHSISPTHIYLINPLTRSKIQLPSRNKFPDVKNYCPDKVGQEYMVSVAFDPYGFYSSERVNNFFTNKIVWSCDPSSDDCLAVAIYGSCRSLAFCKPTDKKWTRLWDEGNVVNGLKGSFLDIIFHKGKLLALKTRGEILSIENIGIGLTPNVTFITTQYHPSFVSNMLKYLVECSDGSLLMIARYIDIYQRNGDDEEPFFRTNLFRILKFDSINWSWFEVKSINNDILFLGLNSSLSISSDDFPGWRNHIFFTDPIYTKQKNSDIGIFNIEDGSFRSLPGFKANPQFIWPPPIFVNFG